MDFGLFFHPSINRVLCFSFKKIMMLMPAVCRYTYNAFNHFKIILSINLVTKKKLHSVMNNATFFFFQNEMIVKLYNEAEVL
jgi:hypothetical protein